MVHKERGSGKWGTWLSKITLEPAGLCVDIYGFLSIAVSPGLESDGTVGRGNPGETTLLPVAFFPAFRILSLSGQCV
jgi:hypothetical protein